MKQLRGSVKYTLRQTEICLNELKFVQMNHRLYFWLYILRFSFCKGRCANVRFTYTTDREILNNY